MRAIRTWPGLAFLVVLGVFWIPDLAAAQTVGVKAGFSSVTIGVSSDGGTSRNPDPRPGFVGGLWLLSVGNRIGGWQIEALVHQKGARNLLRPDDALRLTYLEVPVLLHADFAQGRRLAAFGTFGPSIAFNLDASYENDGMKEDVGDGTARFDIGLNIGGGVEFGRLIVEVRYTWGFRNLFSNGDIDGKFKNRGVAVTAGFWFGR